MPLSSKKSTPSYLLAIAGVSLATATRVALHPLLGDRFPFLAFFIAVVLAAWHGGFGPSILAVGLSWLAIDRFVLEPRGPVPIFGARWQSGFAFFAVGLGVSLL